MLILGLIVIVVVAVAAIRAVRRRAQVERRLLEQQEEKRVTACGEIVLWFANHLGYIARQCIGRNELEELIDGGITPEQLGKEIGHRIQQSDGLVLGYQRFGEA